MKTIVILNTRAGSGRSLRHFATIASSLENVIGEHRVVATTAPDEVRTHLITATREDYDNLLVIGGDGTNHVVLNALQEIPDHSFTVTVLPFGSGSDWGRSLDIPLQPRSALEWLRDLEPRAVDVGRVRVNDHEEYFLNVASAGLTGEVGRRANAKRVKRSWTYIQAALTTLLQFGPPRMRVTVDGERWYEGEAYMLAVANGRFFGRGMKVAPDAFVNDGLFDLILVEGMSKIRALTAFPSLIQGDHTKRGDVHHRHGRQILIEALEDTLDMEMDGETARSRHIEFEIIPAALRMRLDPSAAALLPTVEPFT